MTADGHDRPHAAAAGDPEVARAFASALDDHRCGRYSAALAGARRLTEQTANRPI